MVPIFLWWQNWEEKGGEVVLVCMVIPYFWCDFHYQMNWLFHSNLFEPYLQYMGILEQFAICFIRAFLLQRLTIFFWVLSFVEGLQAEHTVHMVRGLLQLHQHLPLLLQLLLPLLPPVILEVQTIHQVLHGVLVQMKAGAWEMLILVHLYFLDWVSMR